MEAEGPDVKAFFGPDFIDSTNIEGNEVLRVGVDRRLAEIAGCRPSKTVTGKLELISIVRALAKDFKVGYRIIVVKVINYKLYE